VGRAPSDRCGTELAATSEISTDVMRKHVGAQSAGPIQRIAEAVFANFLWFLVVVAVPTALAVVATWPEKAVTPDQVQPGTLPVQKPHPSPTLSEGAASAEELTARYLNVTRENGASATEIAWVMISSHTVSRLGDEVTLALKGRGVELVLFKPAFVSEGRADRLLAGDWGAVADIDLTDNIDSLLIGKSEVTYSQNPIALDMRNANLTLRLRCLRVASQSACGSQTMSALGVGFSEEQALEVAVDKVRALIGSAVEAMDF